MQARNMSARERRQRGHEDQVRRVPPGTFRADPSQGQQLRRASDRPAPVMVLAPVLGLGIWGAILYLILA